MKAVQVLGHLLEQDSMFEDSEGFVVVSLSGDTYEVLQGDHSYGSGGLEHATEVYLKWSGWSDEEFVALHASEAG